jgi:hypothetical protein
MEGRRKEMDWYRQLQFMAAVAMPEHLADEFGTTVNGMWHSPESRSAEDVAEAHGKGQRVLFSVPMIALVPQVYEVEEFGYLLDEVCADIDGAKAEVDWYYWEPKPVYSVCIFSEPFRRYLLDRCKEGVGKGMDLVNLDEINTSIGLMTRQTGGSGFCPLCLDRFRAHAREGADAGLADLDDASLRSRIAADDELFGRYRAFMEREAFTVMTGFIDELRAYTDEANPEFAIIANLAYLGNNVPTHGALWGAMWGKFVDFGMMENTYIVERGGDHLILPRGKFTAWYRLGTELTDGAPLWICPSIMVPRQMAGEQRIVYYELMFVEAYANAGRWGYYWWPGVDVAARMEATVPERLKDYIRFMNANSGLYDEAVPNNDLAILYLDSAIGARPETHFNYLALGQILAEAGFQYDVLYAGDGSFAPDDVAVERLAAYSTVLVPEARQVSAGQAAALEAYAATGGEVVIFSDSPLAPELVRTGDGALLERFWSEYRDEDRDGVVALLTETDGSRIIVSDSAVNAIRYVRGAQQIIHLVNYAYDAERDQVIPAQGLEVALDGAGTEDRRCLLFDLDGEHMLSSRQRAGNLVVEIPALDVYGVLVIE